MPHCKYCGTWSGLMDEPHMECANLAKQGRSAAEIKAIVNRAAPPKPAKPLSAMAVFWAVLGALCAFALLAAIAGGIYGAASH